MFDLLAALIREDRRCRGFDLPDRPQPPAIDVAESNMREIAKRVSAAAVALGLEVDVAIYRSPIAARSAAGISVKLGELLQAVCEAAVDAGIEPSELVRVAVGGRRPKLDFARQQFVRVLNAAFEELPEVPA